MTEQMDDGIDEMMLHIPTSFTICNFGYLTNKFESFVVYFQAWIELQFVGSIQNIANLK
jgi:hypothetical protein